MGKLLQSRFQRGVVMVEGDNELLGVLYAGSGARELGVMASIAVDDGQKVEEKGFMVAFGGSLQNELSTLLGECVPIRRR